MPIYRFLSVLGGGEGVPSPLLAQHETIVSASIFAFPVFLPVSRKSGLNILVLVSVCQWVGVSDCSGFHSFAGMSRLITYGPNLILPRSLSAEMPLLGMGVV